MFEAPPFEKYLNLGYRSRIKLPFIKPFVRYGQFLSSLGPAAGKHFASVSCGHPFPETMLVASLSLRRLKSSL
jgi:hypothetical protein